MHSELHDADGGTSPLFSSAELHCVPTPVMPRLPSKFITSITWATPEMLFEGSSPDGEFSFLGTYRKLGFNTVPDTGDGVSLSSCSLSLSLCLPSHSVNASTRTYGWVALFLLVYVCVITCTRTRVDVSSHVMVQTAVVGCRGGVRNQEGWWTARGRTSAIARARRGRASSTGRSCPASPAVCSIYLSSSCSPSCSPSCSMHVSSLCRCLHRHSKCLQTGHYDCVSA
eukprot:COSAG05_NODE_1817_length_4029_cov_20.545300_3_plen_227_part_00